MSAQDENMSYLENPKLVLSVQEDARTRKKPGRPKKSSSNKDF